MVMQIVLGTTFTTAAKGTEAEQIAVDGGMTKGRGWTEAEAGIGKATGRVEG